MHFKTATAPVKLELSLHSLTHMAADDEIIMTHTFKAVTPEKDTEDVLNCIIKCLAHTTPYFKYSTTIDFKIISLQK